MDYAAAIKQVYSFVENDDVSNAVGVCLRLARNLKDYLNAGMFIREASTDGKQNVRTFLDDTQDLNEEARKFLWDRSGELWMRGRLFDYCLNPNQAHLPEEDQPRILSLAAGELDAESEQCERMINNLAVPPGMSPYDTAAFWDKCDRERGGLRLRIQAINTVKARIKARCLNYAITLEKQLEAQQKSVNFLHETQNAVNNYFKSQSEDVYNKLQKAAQLVDTKDAEDSSLLLTEVRRAIKAAADHFYPPTTELVTCVDGKERQMGEEQYMNRLHEFLGRTLKKSTSKDLLEAEFQYLATFARKLNEISSKGIHAEVTATEAKQGLLGLYMLLSNVIAKLHERLSAIDETAKAG